MPWILIKNNLKLMLRSKWLLVMMILGPVITIALLSNAFKEMMNNAYSIENFKVGYRISPDSNYQDGIKELESGCKKQGITLIEYPEGDIAKLLQSRTIAVFVDIKGDSSYIVYQSNSKEKEAAVINSMLNSFFYQVNEAAATYAYTSEHGKGNSKAQSSKVVTEALDVDPIPNSTDYYGIIYIVYYAWCGIFSLAEVISSERKGALPRRMQAAHMVKINYFLGKYIPCALAVMIEILCAWGLSVLLMNIHWGRLGLSLLILSLLALAASAFGMVLYQIFPKVVLSTVAGFVIIWFAGFFGGSFEPYMYLSIPKWLIEASPIYYIDRTLVEFSTKGSSDYFGACILYLLGIIAVFGLIGILLMNRKMEEQ